MIGRIVSHYQILENIGAGGMGEIYKALDPRLNRFVAIKVLPARMSSDPARRRRFVQEAQAASGLNHPNIITIYDVVLEQEIEFILMEFVAGKTLGDLIPDGGLPVPQALNYCVQIADALTAAHAAGIVHRDLKPGNIMITDAGLVKVLDFGLAKLEPHAVSQVGDEAETVAAEALTVEGSILGTVNYMSPEQAEGQRVDARSDIFSFGVLLYEMVTGLRPFSGASAISTLSSILRDEARPVVEIAPGVPLRVQDVIARCLRKKPEERWQSMQEVRTVLAAIKQESDSSLVNQKEIHPTQFPRKLARRSKMAVMLAAGGILAAVAASVIWFVRQPAPNPGTGPVAIAAGQPHEIPPAVPAHRPPPETKERPEVAEQTERPDASALTPPAPLPAVEPAKPALPSPLAVNVVDGSPISLTLADDIPANAPAGTPIHFTVSKDVAVGGTVAIRKGATVNGEIVQEAKKKFLLFGGKMMMRLMTVAAADDHALKVRATPTRRSDSQPWRPVDAGGRTRPKGVAAVAGTQYIGFVNGNQSVAVQK